MAFRQSTTEEFDVMSAEIRKILVTGGYEKVIYMMEERSANADRVRRFKEKWGGYKKPKEV